MSRVTITMTITNPASTSSQRILVVGLGNLLLADDGVGVHAVRELKRSVKNACGSVGHGRGLRRDCWRGVTIVEVGTAVLDALHLFERADRILAIDAMQAGGPPGRIYRFGIQDAENPHSKVSLHDFGLRSVFEFLNLPRRPDVLILGVEPQTIDYGLDLSPPVRTALPSLLLEAESLINGWKRSAAI